MFGTLIASNRQPARSRRWKTTLLSATVHVLALIPAVWLGAQHTGPVRSPIVPANVVFVTPRPTASTSMSARSVAHLVSGIAGAVPLPGPPSVPPLPGVPVFTPGAHPAGIDPRTIALGAGAQGPTTPGMEYRPLLAEEVDTPVRIVLQPAPKYPAVLQRMGIEGAVVLEFVVDTLGHPEPESVHVLLATHEAFEASARRTIQATVFEPGEVRGVPVRQIVRQRITFRIRPQGG